MSGGALGISHGPNLRHFLWGGVRVLGYFFGGLWGGEGLGCFLVGGVRVSVFFFEVCGGLGASLGCFGCVCVVVILWVFLSHTGWVGFSNFCICSTLWGVRSICF